MTTIAFNSPTLGNYDNNGESGEAKTLSKLFEEMRKSLNNNAEMVEKSIRLEKAYLEASELDWDGYGAVAADPRSYHMTKAFMNLLPQNLHNAEISVDPDGEISLEWFIAKNRLVSISIGGDGSLTYIGFLGRTRMKGVEYFDQEIPEAINSIFRRIIQ
jgi:hypothetical protein